ncbi:hypothetical protein FJZ17_02810 [Candidatus Pacearchaeota archaeon]|nr:hypothetical protein [Candidatus Pacearchaeota archaeon]
MGIRSLIASLGLVALISSVSLAATQENAKERELREYKSLITTNYTAKLGDNTDSMIIRFCREYSLLVKKKVFKERNEKSSRIIAGNSYVLGVSTNFPYTIGNPSKPKSPTPAPKPNESDNITTNKPSEMDLLRKAIKDAL